MANHLFRRFPSSDWGGDLDIQDETGPDGAEFFPSKPDWNGVEIVEDFFEAGGAAPQNYSIVGNVPLTLTPSATMDVTRHRTIIGNVPLSLAPAAVMDVTRHPSIMGDTPLSLVPGGIMDYTRHAAIIGYVPLTLTPAGLMQFTHIAPVVELGDSILPSGRRKLVRSTN